MLVEARRARQRPPGLGRGVGADGDVGKGQAGGEVEAQGPLRAAALVRADQLGKGAADQFVRRGLQAGGEMLGDVGERAAPGGLPEPAAAGLLELLDEARGALRRPVDLDPAAELGGLGAGTPEAEGDEAKGEQGRGGGGARLAGENHDARRRR